MHYLITDQGKGIRPAALGGYVLARHTHHPESLVLRGGKT